MNNPWDALLSTLGSELDSVRKTVTHELDALGLGELEAFVPQLYLLIRATGAGDPLTLILDTASKLAFGNGQAQVTQALEELLSPVTGPVERWQVHKQSMADALQTHWTTMDARITQLYTSDRFQGSAAQAMTDKHQQLKQNGQVLYNQLLDSILADSQMQTSLHQAIQEKSSEIASIGPVGPMALLIALQLTEVVPPTTPQAPPQWIQELEKDVEQWFQDINPFDTTKPLLVRILLGIVDLLGGVELVNPGSNRPGACTPDFLDLDALGRATAIIPASHPHATESDRAKAATGTWSHYSCESHRG